MKSGWLADVTWPSVDSLCHTPSMLQIEDSEGVRLLTLDRPEALNAFNQELYHALASALDDSADDDSVSVVVLTGSGRAFSAGNDLIEMGAQLSGSAERPGSSGFPTLMDAVVEFPKPFICAVNGLALGIGATILGHADLAFMSTDARIKCPFSSLGVAPEAASSYTFPRIMGRQQASWVLMSSKWFSSQQCVEMGLAISVHEPDDLLDVALGHAVELAALPLVSLMATKRLIGAHHRASIELARSGEDAAFAELMGGPANLEALQAFAERNVD